MFLPLIPSDTLNILIDMKLIFRRQESSEVFVTMTIVAGAIKDCQIRAENRLFSFYSVPRVYDFAMLSWFTHSQERAFLLYEALLSAQGPWGAPGNALLLYFLWEIAYYLITLPPISSILHWMQIR